MGRHKPDGSYEANLDDVIRTVGDLKKALANFPDDQEIRLSVPADIDANDPFGHFIGNNLHEYGLVAGSLWSDSCRSHAVVQMPVVAIQEMKTVPEPDDKWFVEPDEDDPNGEGDYF